MKQKLLFTLNLVLICAMGLGVSASRFTHRPPRSTTTTETSLRSLKAANPTNQNRLTADNRDQLVTEVENLKKRIVSLENKKSIITITDELGWKIWFLWGRKHTPECPFGWEEVRSDYTDESFLEGDDYSMLCKIKHPETVVKVWATCTKDIESNWQNGTRFTINYKVGEIDAEGKCVNTRNYSFYSSNGERNLNNKPGNPSK